MLKRNEVAKFYASAEQAKRKCLWPCCDNNAINSHLLQKRGILSFIAENQQLYKLHKNVFTLKMDFIKVGINEALSFKGFCNEHDTRLFFDIENGVVDFSDYNAKLLLNYRAIQHNICKTQINIDFSERSKLYAISKGEVLFASRADGNKKGNIKNQQNYVEHKDLVLSCLNTSSKDFYFSTIIAPKLNVAASAVHQIETRSEILQKHQVGFYDFKPSLIFVHIIPRLDDTLVIISCKNDALSKAAPIILEANVNPVKFVSDTLIKRIETWVCSPSIYFKSFKPQIKRIISECEKYPFHADSDEFITLNIFNKWI